MSLRRSVQPVIHLVEVPDNAEVTMDYVQCIAVCRPQERVRQWAHNTGAYLVCRLCQGYVIGDVGQPH